MREAVKVPGETAATESGKNRSSSLRRALDLLDYLAEATESADGPTLAEIAQGVGLSKSTAHRLLSPLVDYGLVRRTSNGGYEVGVRAVHLAQVYLDRSDVRTIAAPLMAQLRKDIGETCHLVIPDGIEVVYVAKAENPGPTAMASRVGSRQPFYCTAVGKAMLAEMPSEMLDRVVDGGLESKTAHTLTTRSAIESELEQAQARGFAVDNAENELGIRCIGASIKDGTGTVVAAISVSGPDGRMTVDRIDEVGASVTAAASEISRQLGYRRTAPE